MVYLLKLDIVLRADHQLDRTMKLNVDVLLVICRHCDTTTQSRMMKTCRLLNREGARYLLDDADITLEKQLPSFLLFMLVFSILFI